MFGWQRDTIGNFEGEHYLSSTEYNVDFVWYGGSTPIQKEAEAMFGASEVFNLLILRTPNSS